MNKSHIKKLFLLYIVFITVLKVIMPNLGWEHLAIRLDSIIQLRKMGVWNLSLQPFRFAELVYVS